MNQEDSEQNEVDGMKKEAEENDGRVLEGTVCKGFITNRCTDRWPLQHAARPPG